MAKTLDEPTRARAGLWSLPVVSWALYDLANTIFSMNIVSFFFGLWIVSVMGFSDSVFAWTTSGSYAVIFLLSPFLGALTDQASRRMPARAPCFPRCSPRCPRRAPTGFRPASAL